MALLKPLILLIIAYASAAIGNDASYHGNGATVFEFKEDRIVMLRESIVIRYDVSASDPYRQWLAECEFTFRNERNETVEVQMGFPDWRTLDEDACDHSLEHQARKQRMDHGFTK